MLQATPAPYLCCGRSLGSDGSFTDSFMNHIKQRIGTLVTSAYFWVCVIAFVLVIERILSAVYRDELRGTDSVGTTIRNVGLVILGLPRNLEAR